MQGKIHYTLGTVSGAYVGYTAYGASPQCLFFFLGASIGSLLPDIDTPNSRIGKNIPIISFFIKLFLKHRGLLHTPLCGIIFSILVGFLPVVGMYMGLGLFLGYMLHLVQDTFTQQGISWAFPISNRKFHILGISSKNIILQTVISIGIFLIIFMVCKIVTL